MFVRPKDPARETWDGRRAGVEGAIENYGANAAYPIDELPNHLPELLTNVDDLYYSLGIDTDFDRALIDHIAQLRTQERRGQTPSPAHRRSKSRLT